MKRKTLLMVLLCFAFLGVARAQETLIVHDGDATSGYVPVYGFYADAYLKCEMVYPADELADMSGGTISSLKFFTSSPAPEALTSTWQVFLTEVNYTSISSYEGPGTVVYEGTLGCNTEEVEVVFDAPYTYSGGNLLIGVYTLSTGNYKSVSWAGESVEGASITGYSYSGLDGVTTNQRNFLPKTCFVYTPGTPVACPKPTGVTVEYNGGTTASVSWTSDASNFKIRLNGTEISNVSNPYTLTGLELATTYSVEVKTVCGGSNGESDWTSPKTFTTDLCLSEEQCNLTFVLTDTYGDSWNGNAIKVTDVATGIVVATLANQNLDGTNGEETQTVTLAVCDGRELEFSWVAGSYPGETQYTVTDINDEVVLEGSGAFDAFTFTPNCTPTSCPKPKNLTVNYEGGITAELTWEGDASSYDIDVNGTVTTGATSPYTLTGLELATAYEVMVRANCGSEGTSDWTNPVSFRTDMCLPEDMCEISLELADSYGDGWNGAALEVYDYDENTDELTLLDQFTLSGGDAGSYTLNVCTERYLVFYWSSGNYDSECSYTVYDNLGDEIFSGSGAMSDYEIYFVNCNSTCRKPTDFAASNVSGYSAELSWTENGEATSWTIAYMAADDEEVSYIENVTSNPYLFEGLTPTTTYYAMVKADCEDAEKWSDAISFTTTVPCPKPVVTVDPTANTATVTWTGFSESYDLEWTVQPTSKDPYSEEGWYYYDNGTYVGSVGLGGGQFYWGVMFPAGSFEGSLLSTVRAYDINAMVGELIIYNDGDAAPGNEISRQNMEFTGANDWVEFATNVVVDPTKNVWVVFNAADGAEYPIGTSNDDNGDANGRWVEISGTWYDMASVGVEGRANMIRAHFEAGYDPSELNWTSVPGATSPYVIEGLEPETTYIVRVMGHCGDDGDSNWTTVTFTTGSLCDTPRDLESTDVTDKTATLEWVGNQERYTLRYRYALEADPSEPATIILTAGDTWQDGSGYQMLLDADATAYGTIIPETGGLTSSGDASAETYAEFEYKIPVNADGAMTTENIVINNSISIEIPAGTYDWCITNPTPGDRIWIAASNGIGGRYDDFVFEAGLTYEFTVVRYGGNDGVDLTVTAPMSDWIVVDNVNSPYEMTGLTPETDYEWQVQGINESCEGGLTEWSEIAVFTTLEESVITEVDQAIDFATGWNWWSSYLEMDATVEDALKAAIAEENTTATIKSMTGNIMLEEGAWSTGVTLNNESMFMVLVENPVTATLTAAPADPTEHEITLNPGWNWIGFPSAQEMTLTEALASITPNEEDVIKGSAGNATYTADYGWNGSLTDLTPGLGYMYLNGGSDALTLTYPATSKGFVRSLPMERYWMNDTHRHATNMVMLATLDADRFAMAAGNYEIGAFVGDECRGSARLQQVGSHYIAYLTISGENAETVRFYLYDVTNAKELGMAEEQMTYVANAVTGTTHNPMVLNFRSTAVGEGEDAVVSVYPNPAKDKVMVEGNAIETVKVYNVLGQLVQMEQCGNATNVELHLGGLSAGVYTVEVTNAYGTFNKRIVKE